MGIQFNSDARKLFSGAWLPTPMAPNTIRKGE